MQKRRSKVRVKIARYSVGQYVRISKEKAKFSKSAEQNFSTEVFRIIKVIHRTPRPVYELEDLNRKVIDGQFYEELTPVRITKQTQFLIDKILATRTRRGIKQHLVRWKGFNRDFDSWLPKYRKFNMNIGRNHFYVTLFSNASLDLYPDNTCTVFTSHLAHPIDVGTSSSEWEEGLCEVSYVGPSNEIVKPNTLVNKRMVFVYCDLVAPQLVADKIPEHCE